MSNTHFNPIQATVVVLQKLTVIYEYLFYSAFVVDSLHQGIAVFSKADGGNPPIADMMVEILDNVWM